MTTPTFGSLFTGIGGLDLGLERAGWKCAWQVENDQYASKVLARHWPDVARFGDVHAVEPERLGQIDLIAAGFPCQPWSLAGQRNGTGDARNLWPETLRIIRGVRPRLLLLENVTGLIAHPYFGTVLSDLAANGYDAEWDCIPVAAVGAPHLRYRLFVVAYLDCPGQPYLQRQPAEARSHGGAVVDSGGWWDAEPLVGRVVDGIPRRVDRVRGLGNAVVPQVAEWIGRRILAGRDECA